MNCTSEWNGRRIGDCVAVALGQSTGRLFLAARRVPRIPARARRITSILVLALRRQHDESRPQFRPPASQGGDQLGLLQRIWNTFVPDSWRDEANRPHALRRAGAVGDTRPAVIGVPAEQFGRFLVVHRRDKIVAFSATDFHRRLLTHLREQKDGSGEKALWKYCREYRLHDIRLLDQRLRLITDGWFTAERALDEIVAEYAPWASQDAEGANIGAESRAEIENDPEPATREALAGSAVFWEMMVAANGVAEGLRLSADLAFCSGAFGHGSDVQGAIAVSSPQQPTLEVNAAAAVEISKQTEARFVQFVAALAKDHEFRAAFEWDGETVRRTDGGLAVKPENLRDRLKHVLERSHDCCNSPYLPPLDRRGRVSLVPRHWQLLRLGNHQLTAWAQLAEAASASRWLYAVGEWSRPAVYEVVPTIRSVQPDLGTIRRDVQPLFRARRDQVLLVGRLSDLELRCLARTVKKWAPARSTLAKLFAEGADVLDDTTARLRELAAAAGSTAEEGARLSPRPENWWRCLAQMMLFAIPRGLDDQAVRRLARELVGEISAAEMQTIRTAILGLHTDFAWVVENTIANDDDLEQLMALLTQGAKILTGFWDGLHELRRGY